MLAEAAMSSHAEEAGNKRSVKRRRVSMEMPEATSPASVAVPASSPASSQSSERAQQIFFDEFGSSEDESDVEFEDVAIENDNDLEIEEHAEQKSLQLDLSKQAPPTRAMQRRKPVSKAERDYRLNVHKAHLLLLLMNFQLRRRWCESDKVQTILKPLIPRKLRNMLHISDEKPDYQRSHSFNKAIEEICSIWRDEYEITRSGMRSAYWKEDVDAQKEADEFDDPSNYEEFCAAAGTRHGSRDLGAMLFCALLRSAAVETRLVCSLQVLPFSAVAKGQTPEKSKPEYAYRTAWPSQEFLMSNHEERSNPRWRQSEYAGAAPPALHARQAKKKVHDSPYPIFWVEVMLPTTHTWIPLDPLVRKTINKPKTGFEPPLSDNLNSMSYVLAFEDSGFAKDVTRRYAQFFNAKTRRQRVESTKHGDYWWTVTMQWFQGFKPIRSISDVLENKELENKSKNEPMPKNVSDFKDHPVFVLERHLRRNEVIWPSEHRGHFSAGNKDGKSEKVYHRNNVHIVRSAEQWYRKGRDLKVGEQPLKRVTRQRRRGISVDDEDEEQDGTSLYAEFQTELYIPPPVVKGRIPKNQYGNLDVYVPTMIPPGAIHLQHPEAHNAARILGVDFTDAVTGFKFKGRHGTAIINGIVASAEYRDALVEVVQALEYERVREQEEKKSMIALTMWKRFLTALMIRKRIDEEHAEPQGEFAEVEEEAPSTAEDEDEDSTYAEGGGDAGGGFMPDADEQIREDDSIEAVDLAKLTLDPEQAVYHEVVVLESPHTMNRLSSASNGQHKPETVPALLTRDSLFDDDVEDDLFNGSDEGEPGGFLREKNETLDGGGFMVEDDASAGAGGGFFPDEEVADGGGFLTENEQVDAPQSTVESNENEETADELILLPEAHPTTTAEAYSTYEKPPEPALGVHGVREACTNAEDDEEDDDTTSLLSHDPEDDDAEEAWAMDIDD